VPQPLNLNVRHTMKYLPGSEKIIEESLELFSLANALFISSENQKHLTVHPYVEKYLTEHGHRLIIEKILSIAIKLRFLDDKSNLLKAHDRENSGDVITSTGKTEVGLREALNKIIHSESIEISACPTRVTVSNKHGENVGTGLRIQEGVYKTYSIYMEAKGVKGRNAWTFNCEIIHLLNEILRIISHSTLEN
jgi:hypothetical protein